jgi:hypothetical protein
MLETPEAKLDSLRQRRRSLYENVLNETELEDFLSARGLEGIDDEIALFRVKIKAVLSAEKVDVRLLVAATGLLVKLVKTRHEITPVKDEGLRAAIGNVMHDLAIPLGIDTSEESE